MALLSDKEKMQRCKDICELVRDGDSLRQIAKRPEYQTTAANILRFVTFSDEAIADYTAARLAAADVLESEILDTARACKEDNSRAATTLIKSLQWAAERRDPKRYGAKLEVTPPQETDQAALLAAIASKLPN